MNIATDGYNTAYIVAKSRAYHYINLNYDLTPEGCSNTLWHELAHASQAERFVKATGLPPWLFYKECYNKAKGNWGASYINNSFEVEARQIAAQNKHKLLTIPKE